MAAGPGRHHPEPASAQRVGTTNVTLGLQLQDQFGNNTTSTGTTTLTPELELGQDFFATTSGGSGTLNTPANVTFANGVGTATEYYGDETAASPTTSRPRTGRPPGAPRR